MLGGQSTESVFAQRQLFLELNLHLDEIDLFFLGHDIVHVRLEAGIGLNGLCADGALGR